MSLVNIYRQQSEWCRVWILSRLFKRNPSNCFRVVSQVHRLEMYELERDDFRRNWRSWEQTSSRRTEKLTWQKKRTCNLNSLFKVSDFSIQGRFLCMALSSFDFEWVILHTEALIVERGKKRNILWAWPHFWSFKVSVLHFLWGYFKPSRGYIDRFFFFGQEN